MTNYENLIKILILGDSSVGKTNFLLRFTENNFVENYLTTIGFDYKSSNLNIDDLKVKLQIWDTAGQERFMSVTKNLLLRVQGIIVMYDISCSKSFDNTKKWILSIRENKDENMPIILVGNKSDLEANREVTYEKGKEMAKEYKIGFLEASAKENINVKETFISLSREIIKTESFSHVQNLNLNSKKEKSKSCC